MIFTYVFFSFFSFSKNRFIFGKRVKEREYEKTAIENHYFAIVETKSQESGTASDERESKKKKEETRQKTTSVYETGAGFGSCVHSKAPSGLQEDLDISKL